MCNEANTNLAKLNHLQRALYLAEVANFAYLLAGNADAVNADAAARIEEKLKPIDLHINAHVDNPFFDPATNAEGFMATTQIDIVIALKGSWEIAEYAHIVEPEELPGTTHSPTPGILHEIRDGKNLAEIAARAVESSAHSLIGAYIPLLEAATAPVRGMAVLPAARGESNADQQHRS